MTVVWRQWIEGFDSTTAEVGCTATVDTAAGGRDKNKLTSTIASASDTGDRATGDVTTAAWLPSGDQGRFRCKFKPLAYPVGDPWNPLANVTWVRAERTAAIQVIELYSQGSDQRSGCFSAANTLRAASLNSAAGLDPITVGDTEYTAEVAWKGATDSTGFRRVWIDEVLREEVTALDMVTAGDATSTLLALGFHHYDGADAEGLSCEIRWAQLSDDPTEVLVDPVDAIPADIPAIRWLGS